MYRVQSPASLNGRKCRYSSLHGKSNQEIRCNNHSCPTLSLDKQFKFSVEKSTHHFLLPGYTVENHFFVYKFIQTKAHFHKKRRQRKLRKIKTTESSRSNFFVIPRSFLHSRKVTRIKYCQKILDTSFCTLSILVDRENVFKTRF